MQVTSNLSYSYNVFQTLSSSVSFNPLQNDYFLARSKPKAFIDDKVKMVQTGESFFERVENILEEHKTLVTSISSIQCFQMLLFRVPLPITRRQILDSSKLKEFADDNFKFDEICRKLSKQVENTVGKGEIATLRAISPFPIVFSKGLFPRGVKRCHCVGIVC